MQMKILVVLCFRHAAFNSVQKKLGHSFSGSIPPKFEHKLRVHKQRFRNIATAIVLDKINIC